MKQKRYRQPFKIFLLHEEKQSIQEQAKIAGLPTATFIRMVMLQQKVKPILDETTRKAISRFGQNLSQIALRFNLSIGKVNDVQALRQDALTIISLLKEKMR